VARAPLRAMAETMRTRMFCLLQTTPVVGGQALLGLPLLGEKSAQVDPANVLQNVVHCCYG
jgi:hypothetical protein